MTNTRTSSGVLSVAYLKDQLIKIIETYEKEDNPAPKDNSLYEQFKAAARFTVWGHGQTGRERAKELKEMIEASNSCEEVYQIICKLARARKSDLIDRLLSSACFESGIKVSYRLDTSVHVDMRSYNDKTRELKIKKLEDRYIPLIQSQHLADNGL